MALSLPATPNPLPYTYSTLTRRPTLIWTCPNIDRNESVGTNTTSYAFYECFCAHQMIRLSMFKLIHSSSHSLLLLVLFSRSTRNRHLATVGHGPPSARSLVGPLRAGTFCRLCAGLRPTFPGYDWEDNAWAHGNHREPLCTARDLGIALSIGHPRNSKRTQWHSGEPVDRHSGGCAALYPSRYTDIADLSPTRTALVDRNKGPNSDRESFGTRLARRTWPAKLTSATDEVALCQIPDQEDYSPCAS
jgi:hypothetical protein